MPAVEGIIKITEDGSTTIAGNVNAFIAVLDLAAAEGVSTPPSSAYTEDSFDPQKTARELEAIMKDVIPPPLMTHLAPSLTNQGEDYYTSDTTAMIEENLDALQELLEKARMGPGKSFRNIVLYNHVYINYLSTATPT